MKWMVWKTRCFHRPLQLDVNCSFIIAWTCSHQSQFRRVCSSQKWWELKTESDPEPKSCFCYLALFTMDMVMRQKNKASHCKQNIWGPCLINDSTASIKRARALWEYSDVVWCYCASEVKEAFSVFSVEHKERNLQKFTNNSSCVAFSILNTCFYHFAFREQRQTQLGDRQGVKERKRDPWGLVMFKQMGEEERESGSRWEGGRHQKQNRCGGGRGLILVKDKGGQIWIKFVFTLRIFFFP